MTNWNQAKHLLEKHMLSSYEQHPVFWDFRKAVLPKLPLWILPGDVDPHQSQEIFCRYHLQRVAAKAPGRVWERSLEEIAEV